MSSKAAPVEPTLPRLTRQNWVSPREAFAFAVPAPVTAVDVRLQHRFTALRENTRAVQGMVDQGHGRLWFPPTKHTLPDLHFEVRAEGGQTAIRGAVGVPVRDQVIALVVGCAFLLGAALALTRPHGTVPAVLSVIVGGLALGGTRRVITQHPYETRVLVSLLFSAAMDLPWTPPSRPGPNTPPTP